MKHQKIFFTPRRFPFKGGIQYTTKKKKRNIVTSFWFWLIAKIYKRKTQQNPFFSKRHLSYYATSFSYENFPLFSTFNRDLLDDNFRTKKITQKFCDQWTFCTNNPGIPNNKIKPDIFNVVKDKKKAKKTWCR